MADNFTIKINIQGPFQNKNDVYDLRQHKKALQQTFNMAQGYEFGRQDVKITIAPDGKSAEATSRNFERMVVNGQVARVDYQETTTLVVQRRKLVIASVAQVGRLIFP